ncbi:MAG TPA: hypothetical protein PLP17_07880, partial [Oligoflexia bacterium]|nr:hypothetical protein [Oligoflexia bacterium]
LDSKKILGGPGTEARLTRIREVLRGQENQSEEGSKKSCCEEKGSGKEAAEGEEESRAETREESGS